MWQKKKEYQKGMVQEKECALTADAEDALLPRTKELTLKQQLARVWAEAAEGADAALAAEAGEEDKLPPNIFLFYPK